MDMGGLAAIAAELARYHRAAVDAGTRFAVPAAFAVLDRLGGEACGNQRAARFEFTAHVFCPGL